MSVDRIGVGESSVRPASTEITLANRWDHLLARLGHNRMGHRVEPGLHSIGGPGPTSPVFVTANYTLSFDALRSALVGMDGWILVLETEGINVWCAAGKGTFGTDELVRRIEASRLKEVVTQRVVVLPQLGAPGVAAHEVKRRSGFSVEYGPVRAADLPEYLRSRQATPEMRRVRFTLRDRLAVALVDVVHGLLPMAAAGLLGLLLGGPLAVVAILVAGLAGVLLFPILLPWLPTREFSSKGLLLGTLVILPCAAAVFLRDPAGPVWLRAGWSLSYLLAFAPVTAFLALLFTGSTTFTSRSGVRREMFAYIRPMAAMFVLGIGLATVIALVQVFGGVS